MKRCRKRGMRRAMRAVATIVSGFGSNSEDNMLDEEVEDITAADEMFSVRDSVVQ